MSDNQYRDLVEQRHALRVALDALGVYGRRSTQYWNLDVMEEHARAVLSAVEHLKKKGVK